MDEASRPCLCRPRWAPGFGSAVRGRRRRTRRFTPAQRRLRLRPGRRLADNHAERQHQLVPRPTGGAPVRGRIPLGLLPAAPTRPLPDRLRTGGREGNCLPPSHSQNIHQLSCENDLAGRIHGRGVPAQVSLQPRTGRPDDRRHCLHLAGPWTGIARRLRFTPLLRRARSANAGPWSRSTTPGIQRNRLAWGLVKVRP